MSSTGWARAGTDPKFAERMRALMLDSGYWRYCRTCDVYTKDSVCWLCGGSDQLRHEIPPNPTGSVATSSAAERAMLDECS